MSRVKFKNAPFQPNKSNFQSTDLKYKELCNNEEKSFTFSNSLFAITQRNNRVRIDESLTNFSQTLAIDFRIAGAGEVISEWVSTRGNGAAKRTRGVFESEVPPLERRLAPRLGRAASWLIII